MAAGCWSWGVYIVESPPVAMVEMVAADALLAPPALAGAWLVPGDMANKMAPPIDDGAEGKADASPARTRWGVTGGGSGDAAPSVLAGCEMRRACHPQHRNRMGPTAKRHESA